MLCLMFFGGNRGNRGNRARNTLADKGLIGYHLAAERLPLEFWWQPPSALGRPGRVRRPYSIPQRIISRQGQPQV